jgi:hypothetical protein
MEEEKNGMVFKRTDETTNCRVSRNMKYKGGPLDRSSSKTPFMSSSAWLTEFFSSALSFKVLNFVTAISFCCQASTVYLYGICLSSLSHF